MKSQNLSLYITTPLYYINDKPHLGTAYSTILADVLSRYHQLIGYETYLMTGTDEHGQKCQKSALNRNLSIETYCQQMAQQFEQTWQKLNISYNRFFRTTSPWHKKALQKALQKLYDEKQIYESVYEGWYSESEEIFYTSKDLVKGRSPTGKVVVKIKEKNYFFKMSNYQKALIAHIKKHPNFIQPLHRKNEVLSFLKNQIKDLCISRPKSRLSWGVELPFDSNYVTYVWVDALLNYVTGVGGFLATSKTQEAKKESHLNPKLLSTKNSKPLSCSASADSAPPKAPDFEKWWNQAGALHIIGKDILLTHAVYWPSLLLALGIKLPKTILAHGWLLNPESQKMSKSQGDVMDPLNLLKNYDNDSLRYFLIRNLPIGNDAPVSHTLIQKRINEDLANNLGNLFSRTCQMIHQHFNSQIPEREPDFLLKKGQTFEQAEPASMAKALRTLCQQTIKQVKKDILALTPHAVLESIVQLLNQTNRFLEQAQPWQTIKTDPKKTGQNLRVALEIIYVASTLLSPVMPHKMQKLLKALGCPSHWPETAWQKGHFPKAGQKISPLPPLFPRV